MDFLPNSGALGSRRTSAVDQVYDLLLTAIVEGNLAAGHELRDQVLAEHFGLSRTPIREAIKRLEHQGIVAVAAARYTRLVSFTIEQAEHVVRDWAAAHLTLVESLVHAADRDTLSAMHTHHRTCRAGPEARHIESSFRFFEHLRSASHSFSICLTASTAAYRHRLAAPLLPDPRDADLDLHTHILSALHEHDAADLASAFAGWQHAMRHPQPVGG
ncbi:GntR family transcriptional regulator [Agromyces silvae]|uniref:GntR family transcriptional regulator n=1 Tax=Agromyces silvae TaxID=3388266 RepID=UPI00280C1D9C|nr:GntR family transcriptional regulator [Agromyces protaetiae]